MRLLCNAVPLRLAETGIGRYLQGLYGALEHMPGLEIGYFTGWSVQRRMPEFPSARTSSLLASALWALPPGCARAVRTLRQEAHEFAFARRVREWDVYHEAAYFPMRRAATLPTVFTVHDLSLLRMPEAHPRERVRFWRAGFFKRLPLVEHFFAVSEFTKREMVELLGIAPEKITVTLLGVDRSVFRPRADAPDAPRDLPELPEAFALFVGSGDPRKNLDVAVAASRRAGLPLVTAGWRGWAGQGAPEGVTVLGHVPVAVLAELYRRSVALLMPSSYEGFGLPVLEAMACGCPVIASRAASLPEVGGAAVAYVDSPRDAEGFAAALRSMRDRNRAEAFVRAGLERAATFGWERTAACVLRRLELLRP